MAEGSKIEWTDHTFNPWTGCTKITPGCDHCYAEGWAKRSGHVKWGNHERKRTTTDYWKAPVIWNRNADRFEAANGHRQRVFCASLADVFDNQAEADWRKDLFSLIRQTPRLDWLLLTKRPFNIARFLPDDWGNGYHNVWLGMTAEDQQRFDARWQHLASVPAVVRFVSYEPAIGALSIADADVKPDWLIVGGESGGGARSMKPAWVRSIVDECRQFGVAPFFKQWGISSNNPLFEGKRFSVDEIKEIDPHGKGGGLVDGQLIRDFPSVRSIKESVSSAA
jgi:protein gp37